MMNTFTKFMTNVVISTAAIFLMSIVFDVYSAQYLSHINVERMYPERIGQFDEWSVDIDKVKYVSDSSDRYFIYAWVIDSLEDFHFAPTNIPDRTHIDSVFYWVYARHNANVDLMNWPNKIQMYVLDSLNLQLVSDVWNLTNFYQVYGITFIDLQVVDLNRRFIRMVSKRIRVIDGDTVRTHIEAIGRDIWFSY